MSSDQRIEAIGAAGTGPALPTLPRVTSAPRAWPGFVFERHQIDPGQLPQHALAEHCFLLPVGPQAVAYRCRLDGRPVKGDMVPGKIQFRAAGTTVSTEWYAPLDGIFVAVAPSAIQAALNVRKEGDPVLGLHSDLEPQDNPVLLQLALALQDHIRAPEAGGGLLEETLRNAICANLVSSYGGQSFSGARALALSRQTLRRVHDFIHGHLPQEFAIQDIADAACMSPFHLSRAYRRTTGRSLWQYVIQCRAALAYDLMAAHPLVPLGRIAEMAGFESYAQFIAAFRKWYGTRPGAFRSSRL